MTREITPHKGGRNERFEMRVNEEIKSLLKQCTDELNANVTENKLTKADVLIYAFNLLWSLPAIEIHARVHGISAMAYKVLGEFGITVVRFGDGETIVHNSETGEAYNTGKSQWTQSEIMDFSSGEYLDSKLPYVKEDMSLLDNLRK